MSITKRTDTETIQVSDPMCMGVTDPTGQKVYRKDDRGRIELPRHEAKRILASDHRDTRAWRPICSASGSGARLPLQEEYDAWLEGQEGYVTYAAWYRLYKQEGA